ncbi:MAG TPA: ribokinase [Chryseolinea sp.]|nr:ribokinase [Chryseolinea sp.]
MPPPKRIVVVGSSNTDMVIKTESFPKPGETLLGGEFFLFPGGKGANQAVAAARLGGQVTFVAKVGNDVFGEKAREQFAKEGIAIEHIYVDRERPSGVALITVDGKGENTIVVAQGSNGTLSEEDVSQAAHLFDGQAIVLMQLEIPLNTVIHAARLARKQGAAVILNPAPARALPDELLAQITVITPNGTEAETLTGIKVTDSPSASAASQWFRNKGIHTVIITLGKDGAFVFDDAGPRLIESPKVTAIDSTAAGDVFNGALAVALSEGSAMNDAVSLANRAAALSVTRMGAQSSAPHRHELT